MENGSTWGIYVAYGAIVLFLILLALAVLRAGTMYVLLLTLPFLRDRTKPGDSAAAREE